MALEAPKIRISKGGALSTTERYLERALNFYSLKKYDEALLDLDEAIRVEPKNGELYATRGYILVEAGYPDEAESDLAKALKIDPRQWLAHFTRAIVAFRQEKYDLALEHCARAQWIAPLRPEVYIYRAAAYYYQGDKEKASKEIDAALQTMQPGDRRIRDANKWARVIKQMS